MVAGPGTVADIPADFSISHSGPWVGCAAIAGARLGLDLEVGAGPQLQQWVVREALLKATGVGLRAAGETRGIALPQFATQEACVRWRGESWYARRLDLFPGASACVLTSCPVNQVIVRSVPLAELFAI
jgi:phosphopantetheinyl transferase